MSEPGWAFVGGGNIASPKVIPVNTTSPKRTSLYHSAQRAKDAEDESRSPANSSGAQLASSIPAFFPAH